MIALDAPAGRTNVRCVSGCTLLGARDLPNKYAGRIKGYFFECEGKRCKAQVAGWLLE
jgi:hypothetical protein